MPRSLALVTAALLALSLNGAAAQERPTIPRPEPTARDMYVSCYLLVHDNDVSPERDGRGPHQYSAVSCVSAGLAAIIHREGRAGREHEFCLPATAAVRTNPGFAMAHAFIDWFERGDQRRRQASDGRTLFLVAMLEAFPCS